MEKCWIIAWIPQNFYVSKSFRSFNTLIKGYPTVYLLFLLSKHEIGPRDILGGLSLHFLM